MSIRLLLPATLGSLVLLTACNSSGNPSSVATGQATGAPPTASTSAVTTPHPVVAGLPRCHTAGLSALITASSGAAGTIAEEVQLHNTAGLTCQMYGYPGMQLLDGSAQPVLTTVIRGGGSSLTSSVPTVLTVAPGGSAYFEFTYSDVPTGNAASPCPSVGRLEITPPDELTFLTIPFTAGSCAAGTLNTSPVHLTPRLA